MVSLECCKKQHHEPRQKKVGPYKLTNSYTQKPSFQQILTILLFLTQLILHSVFIVPTFDDIKRQILWVLLGFHYTLLIVIVYDYVHLTTFDPVDRLITNEELASKFQELSFCIVCNCYVQMHSNHCNRCNRCSEEFDHHCRFLNNCIGGLNYQFFFRLLCIYTIYNLNVIGQSVWVLHQNYDKPEIAFKGNEWGVIALLILTSLIGLSVGGLLVFHFYIIICQMTTTLQFNYPEKKNKQIPGPAPKITINYPQTPASQRQLAKNQQKYVV